MLSLVANVAHTGWALLSKTEGPRMTNRTLLWVQLCTLIGVVAPAISVPAMANELVAIRPGLMCVSPEALAKLTLPDGSSKAARQNPSPTDIATKRDGQCIDIKLGTHVTVSASRANTSIVTTGGRTYVVPNIDFQSPQAPPSTSFEVNEVVTAPGGRTNYYIKTLPDRNKSGDPKMVIEATYDLNTTSNILLTSKPANDPKQNMDGFKHLFLSPDGKTLYFQTDAWATSNAVHAITIANKQVSFVAPGEIACVVLAGQYQGDLVIEQHRYFVQGGSYDNLWLFDPSGKEVGLVAEDTDAKKVCPTLRN